MCNATSVGLKLFYLVVGDSQLSSIRCIMYVKFTRQNISFEDYLAGRFIVNLLIL